MNLLCLHSLLSILAECQDTVLQQTMPSCGSCENHSSELSRRSLFKSHQCSFFLDFYKLNHYPLKLYLMKTGATQLKQQVTPKWKKSHYSIFKESQDLCVFHRKIAASCLHGLLSWKSSLTFFLIVIQPRTVIPIPLCHLICVSAV